MHRARHIHTKRKPTPQAYPNRAPQVRRQTLAQISVHSISPRATRGMVHAGNLRLPCALGRAGRSALKREGDGASPIGKWPVRSLAYRADRIKRPFTYCKTQIIRRTDGWCDQSGDRNYNRAVRHPYAASAEQLWREDHVYDLILVLGYNDRPRQRGRGSAIFMHIARPGYMPTEGCIALSREHLLRLVRLLDHRTKISI
jgi:L,D-peptidoglycan transpeptidase YkuD (ErfK/YbiS/YcfS/YnhG family)